MLVSALAERLQNVVAKLDLDLAPWPRVAAWALVAASAALLALAACRLVASFFGSMRATEREPTPSVGPNAPAPRKGLSPSGWRTEVEARLSRGEASAALEAAWWWLATSLLPGEVDPAWTTRELLGVAGRQDLGRPARTLDRLLYGPEQPRPHDVRRLMADLERVLT
jgi:hypothetical protein